jgi:hypothetical protein
MDGLNEVSAGLFLGGGGMALNSARAASRRRWPLAQK